MILHVFEEQDPEERANHLEFWFGYPEFGPNYVPDSRHQVCYCGAVLVPLEKDQGGKTAVAAVWHEMEFDTIFFDERGPFNE